MKNYLPIIILLSSISAFGQSFWSEDFSNGFPSDWTTEDLSGNTTLWDFCNATDCNVTGEPFQSNSASNGFLMVKPQNFLGFKSILTSAPIDCSDKESVFLEFETYVHTWEVSAAQGYHLYIKNENEDWTQYELLPEQNKNDTRQLSHNTEKITLDISNMAAMNSAVQIRWEWVGEAEENLALDDVRLYDYEPYYDRVVWGNEPGQGDFDNGLNDWTVNTLIPANDSIIKWEWEALGSVAKAYSISGTTKFKEFNNNYPYLPSYSNLNGAAVFNADFFSTMGKTRPPNPPPTYVSELISPIIDLSDIQNDVNLRFEQLVMLGGKPSDSPIPSITYFSYSKDGGTTWGELIPFNETQVFDEIKQSTEILSLCGVAGTEELRLKFTFYGQLYFWAIDDVILVEKDLHDLQIKPNFYSVAPNFQTPASQTEPIFFLMDVENFGTENQQDVELSVVVTDLLDSNVVFEETHVLDEVKQCELRGNEIFGRFVPPNKPTEYEVTYNVKSEGIDATPTDNTLSWNFEISEKTYAKENGRTTGIQPNDPSKGYEFGNCFYLENGSGYNINSITFGLEDPLNSAGAYLSVLIYRFYGDINENGDIDVDERELVGVGDYTVKGTEKETSDGLVTVGILRLPSLDSVGVHTEDGTYYLATVRYFNAGNIPCPLQASQEIDYLATYFMYDSLNLPRYAGLEIDELGQAFKLLALLDLIPVIRINLVERIVGVVDVNEAPLLLHPNPTNGTFSLLTTPKTQDAILELYDLKGRVLKKWDAIHDTYSIEEFSKGIYLLKMTMADEVFVGKVIKG